MSDAEYDNFCFDYILYVFKYMKKFELFPPWYEH